MMREKLVLGAIRFSAPEEVIPKTHSAHAFS
jgi:hypothetical protein